MELYKKSWFWTKKLYGEDLPTELYQRMQMCHNMAQSLAQESTDKVINQYTKEHNKNLVKRTFKEGEKSYWKSKILNWKIENFVKKGRAHL